MSLFSKKRLSHAFDKCVFIGRVYIRFLEIFEVR